MTFRDATTLLSALVFLRVTLRINSGDGLGLLRLCGGFRRLAEDLLASRRIADVLVCRAVLLSLPRNSFNTALYSFLAAFKRFLACFATFFARLRSLFACLAELRATVTSCSARLSFSACCRCVPITEDCLAFIKSRTAPSVRLALPSAQVCKQRQGYDCVTLAQQENCYIPFPPRLLRIMSNIQILIGVEIRPSGEGHHKEAQHQSEIADWL